MRGHAAQRIGEHGRVEAGRGRIDDDDGVAIGFDAGQRANGVGRGLDAHTGATQRGCKTTAIVVGRLDDENTTAHWHQRIVLKCGAERKLIRTMESAAIVIARPEGWCCPRCGASAAGAASSARPARRGDRTRDAWCRGAPRPVATHCARRSPRATPRWSTADHRAARGRQRDGSRTSLPVVRRDRMSWCASRTAAIG